MTDEVSAPSGPDLTKGVARIDFADGRLVGHVGGDDVLLVEAGSEIFAVGAHCTHYHGPLADGLVVGTSVRCPWHHACFDLRSGESLRAPALSPIDCWKVEQRDCKIFVKEKLPQPKVKSAPPKDGVNRIVIVGGGAAGFAAAEMLRRRGNADSIADHSPIEEAFQRHLVEVNKWLTSKENVKLLRVHYHRVLREPKVVAEEIAAFLQMPLDMEAMVQQVDGSLYRNRMKK